MCVVSGSRMFSANPLVTLGCAEWGLHGSDLYVQLIVCKLSRTGKLSWFGFSVCCGGGGVLVPYYRGIYRFICFSVG